MFTASTYSPPYNIFENILLKSKTFCYLIINFFRLNLILKNLYLQHFSFYFPIFLSFGHLHRLSFSQLLQLLRIRMLILHNQPGGPDYGEQLTTTFQLLKVILKLLEVTPILLIDNLINYLRAYKPHLIDCTNTTTAPDCSQVRPPNCSTLKYLAELICWTFLTQYVVVSRRS